MIIEPDANLIKEWQALHHCHESYERFALMIKLFAVTLSVLLIAYTQLSAVTLLMLAILWLQEGIWKTYQARTSDRITLIEQALKNSEQNGETSMVAFQFYQQWRESRPSSLGLIKEYILNSLKPTVIYPYLPLMVITLFA